jgi:acyl-[acyl-carrier-protein]-phospholipid O-acyltransferase / long-chain-fatty-acid--[acyl-carrier-protein] ligase
MDGPLNESLKSRIRQAHAKFAAMVAVYFAGTLNDNFCRQGVMLLAVAAGLSRLQSYITVLFTVPFIIFAAYAGYLADRFSKRSVVIGVKLVSLVAYILGAVGLYLMSWPIILITVFVLGIQATFFSPAINGIIPELYPADYVVTANGIITVAVNAAILLGIAIAGLVLDVKGAANNASFGVYLAAGIGLGIAFITFVISFFVPKFPAASPKAKFPWQGPLDSVITLAQTRQDPLLATSILAKAFFWFAGSLQILIINPLGLSQFGLTKTMTSVLVVIELVGVAVGSMLAPIFARGQKWYRVLAPVSFVMAGSMLAVAAVPYLPSLAHKAVVIGALAMLGIAGGVFSIPVTSFIQVRPAPQFKGRMIASSNFADFVGILLSGVVFYIFDHLHVRPSNCFAIEALMIMAAAGWLLMALPKESDNA